MSGGAYLSTIDLFLFLGAQHQKNYALHHIITFRSLLVHKKRALHVVKRALSPGKRALYSCILAIEPCFLAKEPGILVTELDVPAHPVSPLPPAAIWLIACDKNVMSQMSYHTYVTHVGMSQVTEVNETCHTYTCVILPTSSNCVVSHV